VPGARAGCDFLSMPSSDSSDTLPPRALAFTVAVPRTQVVISRPTIPVMMTGT
jgi:hypothetical protein